jgi:hypothetical protein
MSPTNNVTTIAGFGEERAADFEDDGRIDDAWDVSLGLQEDYLVVAEKGGESE